MTAEITVERALSDYLAVSRNAGLYGPGEYEDAELRAWERLQLARAAAAGPADKFDAPSAHENASGGNPGPHNPVSTT